MQRTHVVRVEQTPLAFGMEWVPVLDDLPVLRAQARRRGASHSVTCGDPPAAQGLAYGVPARLQAWSAAQLLARQYPRGTFACIVPLDAQRWHVLACHEGVALVRADRSYPDHALALQAVDALRRAYPRLQILPALPPDAPEGVLRVLARRAVGVAPLARVRRLPRRLALAVLAGLLPVVLGVQQWRSTQASPAPAQQARLRWLRALDQGLAQRPVQGPSGTRALLDALYRQPVRLAGWGLQAVRCQAHGGGAPWRCVGEYRRQDVRADNRGLLSRAPADWVVEFPSLDRALARWPLDLPARPPRVAELPDAGRQARDWSSAVQAVLPAFSVLRLEKARALPISAPLDDAGQALAPPADLARVWLRTLRVRGPLWSARLLEPLSAGVSWRQAHLLHAPVSRAGLRSSRLILQLEGDLYEKHR